MSRHIVTVYTYTEAKIAGIVLTIPAVLTHGDACILSCVCGLAFYPLLTCTSFLLYYIYISFKLPGVSVFCIIYFSQVVTALQEVDDAIGLFMENLVHDDVTDCFDIVIASTNGQLDVSCENTTYFDTVCVRIKTKRSKKEHFVNRTFFKSRLSFSSVDCCFKYF